MFSCSHVLMFSCSHVLMFSCFSHVMLFDRPDVLKSLDWRCTDIDGWMDGSIFRNSFSHFISVFLLEDF